MSEHGDSCPFLAGDDIASLCRKELCMMWRSYVEYEPDRNDVKHGIMIPKRVEVFDCAVARGWQWGRGTPARNTGVGF